uniref:Cnidarian restricted protein n=1 Tax=Clytia hemisphaerica TaxID=252671 RepID=A0A7M5WR20_9CNID
MFTFLLFTSLLLTTNSSPYTIRKPKKDSRIKTIDPKDFITKSNNTCDCQLNSYPFASRIKGSKRITVMINTCNGVCSTTTSSGKDSISGKCIKDGIVYKNITFFKGHKTKEITFRVTSASSCRCK